MYKEGQIVRVVVCKGSNPIISNTMVEYLKVCAMDRVEVEIPDNKDFVMEIKDGQLEEIQDGGQTILLVVMTAKIVKI